MALITNLYCKEFGYILEPLTDTLILKCNVLSYPCTMDIFKKRFLNCQKKTKEFNSILPYL